MCPDQKAASENQRPETLTIITALLVLTVVIAGLIGVVSANRRARPRSRRFERPRGGGAYRRLTEVTVRGIAADLAERHGAAGITVQDRPETVGDGRRPRRRGPWGCWAGECVPAPG